MEKILFCMMILLITISGCGSTGVYRENYSNELYDGYTLGTEIYDSNASEFGNVLINEIYDDDKVHVYGDGQTFLINYQNSHNFYYEDEIPSLEEFEFTSNVQAKDNGFYELYTLNSEYPEDYQKFIDNPPIFKLDNKDLEIVFEKVDSKIGTEKFEMHN